MSLSRRDVLVGAGGLAAGSGLLGAQAQTAPTFTPEKGAELRLLRWSPFVKAEEEQWIANTKRFTDKFGVPVRIDKESWEDIRPKAAVAASVGSGPDMVLVWFDDPFQYADKLLDVTPLATYLGQKYGGWYPGLETYAKQNDKFIALPVATISNAILYRESWVKEAGWSKFPTKTDDFLELCKALKAKGHPAGFAHGHAVGDGNNYAHWLLWSHGAQMVDDKGKVVLNSPETVKSIKYASDLYKTFIAGTESWGDVNNNRAFLAGEISLTANGISLYATARNDPKTQDLANDIKTANLPIGPVGKSIELFQVTSAVTFKHTKYPQAAQAYLQFMFEAPQMPDWINASVAYCCQSLKAYADNPVWKADPNNAPYAQASSVIRPNGFAGPLGSASAAAMADYILVDMYAEAVTGQRSAEEAAQRAETRAKRYYRA